MYPKSRIIFVNGGDRNQTNIPEMARQNLKAAEDRMNSDTDRMLNEIEAITQPIPAQKVEKK